MQRRLRVFSEPLQSRLLRGEHLTLFGPRGSGKSTVLQGLYRQLCRADIPCAYAPVTSALDHITCALEQAYPDVDTLEIKRRAARMRLWNAADRRAGVLLLDHFSCTSSAMVSFLRRLHGKIVGVLTAVDTENDGDRREMRPWRYGAMSVRMPLASAHQLRKLLQRRTESMGLPAFDGPAQNKLVAAAHGRPGWIVKCTDLARQACYWCEHGPLVSVICVDTEAAVRYEALDMVREISAAPKEDISHAGLAKEAAQLGRAPPLGNLNTRLPMADRMHRG